MDKESQAYTVPIHGTTWIFFELITTRTAAESTHLYKSPSIQNQLIRCLLLQKNLEQITGNAKLNPARKQPIHNLFKLCQMLQNLRVFQIKMGIAQ